jgi:hypothetical protein
MTEAHPFTPTLTRTHAPCAACNAAYRREALALFERLVQAAPDSVVIDDEMRTIMVNRLTNYPAGFVQGSRIHPWATPGRREMIAEINNADEPYRYVTCFRTTLHDDGVSAVDIPAAQHCTACEALSLDAWQ